MTPIDIAKGEPDFHTPAHIKKAACEAIDANFTKYTPQPGIPELREAIADKFRRENGIMAAPDDIVVSCGGKHSVEQAIRALIRPGDEALLITPHWFAYPEQVKLAGGVPVLVEAHAVDGFVPRIEALEQALTPRTRLIVFNTPNNPTGAVYPRPFLEQTAELALEHSLYVLSDEVYEHIRFEGAEHVSLASLSSKVAARTITVNSVSKTHAMTGWRIGYAHLPDGGAARVTAIQQVSTSAPCAVSQRAALAALTGPQDHVTEMTAAYAVRRTAMLQGIASIPGLEALPPRGAFYCFVNMSGLVGKALRGHAIHHADSLVRAVREEAGVHMLSAASFGAPQYLRLSFAVSLEAIEEGLDRLSRLISEGD